jgi:deoxyribodipyrimidine photolyase-related protein
VVLGDQLSPDLSALEGIAEGDVVLMAEVMGECSYVRHHKKKLVLVLSAMRHFAAELRRAGITVDYVQLDDPDNTHSLTGEVGRAIARHRASLVVATAPGEWRVLQAMRGWEALAKLEIREDGRFLCSLTRFRRWAAGRTELRMEFFYREMRRHHGVLMDGSKPLGGRWNFDAENRKRLPTAAQIPPPLAFPADSMTQQVIALVTERFSGHFGDVEGFDLPVTREAARSQFAAFVAERLPQFGDWQDAMRVGEPLIYHAGIASALNLGLLDALTLCREVERGRGVYSTNFRLARICARRLLAAHATLPDIERVSGDAETAGVFLDWRNIYALPAGNHYRHTAPCLRPPHPAPDGHREFCLACRNRSG